MLVRLAMSILGLCGLFFLFACDNRDFREAAAMPFSAQGDGRFAARFFGTTSFLFTTDKAQVMVDGYFSRSFHLLFLPIQPKADEVTRMLEGANVRCIAGPCDRTGRGLDFIIPLHGHYDHAMDTALIAGWTGATRVTNGSLDNLHVATAGWANAQGWPIAEAPSLTMEDVPRTHQAPYNVGDMGIQVFETPHNENKISNTLPDVTSDTFRFPATIFGMGEGEGEHSSVALLLTHEARKLLILGSAGKIDNQLDGVRADVVFLSIGGLKPTDAQALFTKVIEQTGATRVFLVHWDNHQMRLPEPGGALSPTFFEPHAKNLRQLRALALKYDVELMIPPTRSAFDPFAGLQGP